VVVALHSQSKKIKCWKCSQETTSLIFCDRCHSIQDYHVGTSISHYEVLNLPETLIIDENKLRHQFYELSKKLHPDRFVNENHPAPQYALRWTTALNRAYQTLKNREERTQYLVEKYLGASPQAAKAAIPTDLAEAYFEVQDLLSEGHTEPLLKFRAEIENQMEESQARWNELAQMFDQGPNKIQAAESLRKHENREKYIRSMLSDIERKVTS